MELQEKYPTHRNLPPELWRQLLKNQKKPDKPVEYLRPLLKIIAKKIFDDQVKKRRVDV